MPSTVHSTGWCCCICSKQMLLVHSTGGSAFLHEMRYGVASEIGSVNQCVFTWRRSCQFHPNPIWNDGALGFFRGRPNSNNKNKISRNNWTSLWSKLGATRQTYLCPIQLVWLYYGRRICQTTTNLWTKPNLFLLLSVGWLLVTQPTITINYSSIADNQSNLPYHRV